MGKKKENSFQMSGNKLDLFQEWLSQAKYDLDTARAMFKTGRYIYCVFMCHLSIEKILKAHYVRENKSVPPKTHDLIYLCENIKISLPEDKIDFINELNDISVFTRYPGQLKKILKEYSKKRTERIYNSAKKIFLWLKKNSQK